MRRAGGWLALAWRYEVASYRSLVRFVTRRPYVPAGTTPVSSVGAISVLLWAFVVGSAVELVALHLILPWERVRLVADIIGVWGLVWMLGFTAAYYVHPHLIGPDGLVLRSGHHVSVAVPWHLVERLGSRERSVDSNKSLQYDDGVLLLPMGGRTNVELHLAPPLEVEVRGRTESVTEVRFFADDPGAVRAAARAQLL